jgi:hypothetical protein
MREAPPTPELRGRLIPLSVWERPTTQVSVRPRRSGLSIARVRCSGGECQADPDLPTTQAYHVLAMGTIVAIFRSWGVSRTSGFLA